MYDTYIHMCQDLHVRNTYFVKGPLSLILYLRFKNLFISASALPLLSPIGCLLCGYMIDKFGRRTMLIYSQLPVCLGWFYISIANTATKIIIGKSIS